MFRHPSSVISRSLQSLPFTPIRLFRAVDTYFFVPTILNRYSPGKWLREGLFLGDSLSTANYHDLWSASVIRQNRSGTDFNWRRITDDGRGVNGLSYFISERFWLKRTTDDWSGRRMVWRTGVNGALAGSLRFIWIAMSTAILNILILSVCGRLYTSESEVYRRPRCWKT